MSAARRTLELARALLEDGQCWLQQGWAHDAAGKPCAADSLDAERLCLAAALVRAATSIAPDADHSTTLDVLAVAERELLQTAWARGYARRKRITPLGTRPLVMAFNDSPFTTHGDLLAVLDATIARMSP